MLEIGPVICTSSFKLNYMSEQGTTKINSDHLLAGSSTTMIRGRENEDRGTGGTPAQSEQPKKRLPEA